jgi:hypothetical protein
LVAALNGKNKDKDKSSKGQSSVNVQKSNAGAMTKKAVKDYILQHMKNGKVFWMSEAAAKLPDADLLTIRDAVHELKAEGKLKTPEV